MTRYYSDHYIAEPGGDTTLPSSSVLVDSQRKHATLRYKYCKIPGLAAEDPAGSGDTLRLFTVKSGDVPVRLHVTPRNAWHASYYVDIGLAQVGTNHNGPLIHAVAVNLLGDHINIVDDSLEYEEVLQQSGSGMNYIEDLGKPFWEIAKERVTDLVWTQDPLKEWDVVATIESGASGDNGVAFWDLWYAQAVG